MSDHLSLQKDIKQKIAREFGRAAAYYDEHADIQKEVARRLIASLEPWKEIIPAGPIIELGGGTGFVTDGLAKVYPDRKIVVTDLSEEMLEISREKLQHHENLSFKQLDAEQSTHDEPHYAMVISGFTAQWFKDTALTLGRWMEAIKPGGLLLASFPGNDSFPEWKEQCRKLGLPFTGNTLPDTEEVVIKLSAGPAQVDFYEDTVTRTFDSSRDFFNQLKRLGAGTQKQGRPLSPKELSLLINQWDSSAGEEIRVSYHIVFLAVKRDFNS